MRLQLASYSLGVFVAGIIACSPAHAYDRRFCMIGNGYNFPGYCAYDTYASCTASAAGFAAYCNVNPRYAFGQQTGGSRRRGDGGNLSPLLFGPQGLLQ
ncbi:MAG TPA: DUF3551 domain-containing protein [Afipia sp.]